MAQVLVNFRLDETVKQKMEAACKEMGITMTNAFTVYATKVGNEKRIPFEIAVDPFYSDENMNRLRKSIEQMEKTGGTVHEVDLDDKIVD